MSDEFAGPFDADGGTVSSAGDATMDNPDTPDTISADELAEGIFGGDAYVDGGGPHVQGMYDDGSAGPAADPDPEPATATASPPTSIAVDYEGTTFDAGEATFDADGDGVADTAVQDHGYQVEYYIDTDGDGQADELTITDEGGNLISHEQLVPGSDSDWQETPAPDTAAGDVSVVDAPADSAADSTGDPGGATTTAAQPVASGDVVPAGESVPDGDLAVSIDGTTYDVGSASLDMTGDGVADTVVVENDGNVEYYVDTDADGVADQIIVLDEANGALIAHQVYDAGTGTWANVTDESAGG